MIGEEPRHYFMHFKDTEEGRTDKDTVPRDEGTGKHE
jgi:hypothetical protein